MSYAVLALDSIDAVGWSQAVWRIDGRRVPLEECPNELIHDVILRHSPRDRPIVDAGCGTGRWPIYLKQRGYRVLGIDISDDACSIARENDASVDMVRADLRRVPIRDASLGAVLSLGVVEHDEQGPLPALRELHRILAPGGILILAVPYDNLLRRLLFNRLHRSVTRRRMRDGWKLCFSEYRFSAREVRRFLAESGFETIAVYPNEILPPRNMGIWVDLQNLRFDPFRPLKREDLFVLPGWQGRVATALVRLVPWLVCGEIVFVARAR